MHAPDDAVPLSSTLAGVNEAYKKGYFSRFGLSNYRVEDVEAVYNHCNENGYVLPTVYQGNYSPVARKQDTLLFPTLRRLKIAFYAYSPLAGGFLTKTKEQIKQGAGRFGDAYGGMYSNMYAKPAYLAALSEWEVIAKEVGCSKADLAYRWVSYNSPLKPEQGDGIIVGASSLRQFEQTMEGLKAGPLPDEAVKRIDHVWKTIEHEAPLDNYNDNLSLFKK
jgi:aflatoxin B1 aldehyde reductase